MLDGWCLHKTNIITFNHCQARSNSTTHMYCPSGGIPRPKAKGGWDCFFTFGGLLCTWPVKLSYRNQSPNCIDIMSSRVLHLPSVCTSSHYLPLLVLAACCSSLGKNLDLKLQGVPNHIGDVVCHCCDKSGGASWVAAFFLSEASLMELQFIC